MGLLEFVVESLTEHMQDFQQAGGVRYMKAQCLLAAGEAAMAFNSELRQHSRLVPREGQERLWASYMKHVTFFLRAGGQIKPKHHQMFHCIQRIHSHGNPLHYHTFKDESLNGVIAKIARSCHRTNFGLSVHMKFNALASILGTKAVELHP